MSPVSAPFKPEPATDAWAPRVTLSPAAAAWPDLARAWKAPAEAAAFRAELGLGEGLVVMSGHQAEVWHAGILTKLFALREAAASLGARSAWVVVDQDANEPGVVRYPTRTASGQLETALWRISATDATATDTPIAARPAFTAAELEPNWGRQPAATGPAACGLGAIRDALLDAAGEATLAGQLTRATRALLRRTGDADVWFNATAIARTGLFADLLARMAADPAACVRAYNAAAAGHAGAGISQLSESKLELPLWRIRPGAARGRVTAGMLGQVPPAELAPRALLMTGMLRRAACDLFVHGLGGGRYDVVAEEWLRSWLGWELAPAVVATGTLLARLEEEPPPAPEELARARWSLHHARHTPARLGDAWAQRRKEELVEEIRGVRGRGGDAGTAFNQLQDLLSRVRIEHSAALTQLSGEVARLEQRSRQARVALDRTWPFPLHEAGAIDALAAAVRGCFGRA